MATATPKPTPNPNAMKYELDVTLDGTRNYQTAQAAQGDPLAEAIFAITGVRAVFAVNDFVTVTREPDGDWDQITPQVQSAVAQHL